MDAHRSKDPGASTGNLSGKETDGRGRDVDRSYLSEQRKCEKKNEKSKA